MKSARLIALAFTVASAEYSITDIMNQQDQSGPQVQTAGAAPQVQSSVAPTNTGSAAAGEDPLVASLGQPQQAAGGQLQTAGSSQAASPQPAEPAAVAHANNAMPGVEPAGAMPGVAPAGPNPMATLLNNMVTPQQGQQQPGTLPAGVQPMSPLGADGKPINGVLSQDSMAVVSGLVESFMHKVQLQPGERTCLERNVGQLTGDIMGTVGDIVTAIEALVQGKGTIQKENTGGVVSAGIDSAMKITSLVALSTQLVKNCVHGDALALLKETAHHLINGTYLEHRFIVNGVDIAHSLSDSVVAFESKDFHRFGADIGFALRKILLSNARNGTRLPEGEPDDVVIQKCTDGLMKGFFVQGSAVEITDTVHPDIDVTIDLHQCIAGNSDFFKELWEAAWNLIASLSMNAEQHGLDIKQMGQAFQRNDGKQPKWAGELMIAMMQFPMALSRCGVAQQMQDQFMEALQSLNSLRVQVRLPDDRFRAADDATKTEETTARMAKAVEAFTKWNFEEFGFEIGKMLRELVMLAFPQQSAVGAAAGAPVQPVGAAAGGPVQRKYSHTDLLKTMKPKKSDIVPEVTAIIGGAAVSMLVVKFSLVVVRLRRSAPSQSGPSATSDVEGGEEPALE